MIKEAVRAIIRNNEHQVLLGLRPPDVYAGNQYSMLGGKLNIGESPEMVLSVKFWKKQDYKYIQNSIVLN